MNEFEQQHTLLLQQTDLVTAKKADTKEGKADEEKAAPVKNAKYEREIAVPQVSRAARAYGGRLTRMYSSALAIGLRR